MSSSTRPAPSRRRRSRCAASRRSRRRRRRRQRGPVRPGRRRRDQQPDDHRRLRRRTSLRSTGSRFRQLHRVQRQRERHTVRERHSNATLEPWAVINMDEVGGSVDLSSFFSSASNLASANGAPASSWIATLQGLATGDTFIGTVRHRHAESAAAATTSLNGGARRRHHGRRRRQRHLCRRQCRRRGDGGRSARAPTRCSRRSASRSAPTSRT